MEAGTCRNGTQVVTVVTGSVTNSMHSGTIAPIAFIDLADVREQQLGYERN